MNAHTVSILSLPYFACITMIWCRSRLQFTTWMVSFPEQGGMEEKPDKRVSMVFHNTGNDGSITTE